MVAERIRAVSDEAESTQKSAGRVHTLSGEVAGSLQGLRTTVVETVREATRG
jgi:hypothetical protein